MENKDLQLTQEEELVVIFMRKYGPYVDFTVEKRPCVEFPEGKITRIVTSLSNIVDKQLNDFVK
jgi:hypothetical protein